MKNYLFAFSSIVMIALIYSVISGTGPFNGDPKDKEIVIIKAVKTHLEQVHYKPQDVNDEFSQKVFDLYMKNLDGNKRFLLQSEVDTLTTFRNSLDEELNNSTLILFNQSYDIIESAIKRSEKVFEEMISYDFDFDIKESIQMDEEKREYAKDEVDLKEMWRKTLKYDILLKLNRKIKKQDKLELKLKEDKITEEDETEIKSIDELTIDAKEEVKENFEKWFKRLSKVRRSDRFESYINSLTHVYDPHSDYYNPKEKEDFDIRMRGKLEGIGARLSPDGDLTKVVSIVPGGPAWKGKELEAGDLISAVKQENEEKAVNIEGMRLDDVVQKIRGKKGTVVILTVKKADESVVDIRIVRDLVITEEGNAKSAIINMEGVEGKIGYIYLPSFYADFKDRNGRSCAKDIATELEKLKAQNVDGIIMDIRNNGGGSLRDVVDMSGLFIESGPIVQVKPKGKKPHVLEDEDSSVQYDGPMIIMVNEYSISASEILAAALQDYHRALIVGSTSTFGKGTVQRFFNLDNVRGAKEYKPLGQVKMTIQKFFRIDGTSTQLKGVVPDIILPDYFQFIKTGEKDYDHPLEWTEIDKVHYTQDAYVITNYDDLRQKSEERVNESDDFKLILENAQRLKDNQDDRVYPLQLENFKTKMADLDADSKKYKNIGKDTIMGLTVSNLSVDMDHIQSDSSRIGRNESFIGKLYKDIYLEETVKIMNDMIK